MKKFNRFFTLTTIVLTTFIAGIIQAQTLIIDSTEEYEPVITIEKDIEYAIIDQNKVVRNPVTKLKKQELPNQVRRYLNTYFSNNEIDRIDLIEASNEFRHKVVFQNDDQLVFNRNNELIEISSDVMISENIIPPFIELYIEQNYPEDEILKWSMTEKSHLIVLDSKTQIILNDEGEFIELTEI